MVVLMARFLSFAIFPPSLYPDQGDLIRGVIFRALKFCFVFLTKEALMPQRTPNEEGRIDAPGNITVVQSFSWLGYSLLPFFPPLYFLIRTILKEE